MTIRRGRTVVALLVVAVVLGVIGTVGVMRERAVTHPTPAERSAVQQAAASAVTAMMTFAPSTPSPRPDVVALLTGRLEAEYRTQGPDLILPNAVDSRTSMSATVIGAAVNSYSVDDARVLVFVDQKITVPGLSDAERITVARWAVLHRVDGSWRLRDLTAVDTGA